MKFLIYAFGNPAFCGIFFYRSIEIFEKIPNFN